MYPPQQVPQDNFAVGQKVLVHWGNDWYSAVIECSKGEKAYRVVYEADNTFEIVNAVRIRARVRCCWCGTKCRIDPNTSAQYCPTCWSAWAFNAPWPRLYYPWFSQGAATTLGTESGEEEDSRSTDSLVEGCGITVSSDVQQGDEHPSEVAAPAQEQMVEENDLACEWVVVEPMTSQPEPEQESPKASTTSPASGRFSFFWGAAQSGA